jgi:hypothetical protein
LQRATEKTDKDIAFCREQLNELYGPLYLNRETSKKLYDQLIHQMGVTDYERETWRLVDHVEQVQAKDDELATSAVEGILAINAEIVKLIKSHWGLITLPPPSTFIDFISHQAMLQQAWEKRRNQAPTDRNIFPRGFDPAYKAQKEAIEKRLSELSG